MLRKSKEIIIKVRKFHLKQGVGSYQKELLGELLGASNVLVFGLGDCYTVFVLLLLLLYYYQFTYVLCILRLIGHIQSNILCRNNLVISGLQ